ncbi:MAG: PilZ domain-containing protein, partial [Nitrospinota bacterium]
MLKRRPLTIRLLALAYLLTPLTFILQYIYFTGLTLTDPALWNKFQSPYMMSFLVVPPIIAVGIYRIREWGWFLALVHILFLMINNALAIHKGSATPPYAITLFTVATFVFLMVFVRKEVLAPYFNPRIRWWESKPRYAVTLQVTISNNRLTGDGETFNISETGMFMASPLDVRLDEKFLITMQMPDQTPVHCDGSVVWVNRADSTNAPRGFGVLFTDPDYSCLDTIRHYLKEQKKHRVDLCVLTPM